MAIFLSSSNLCRAMDAQPHEEKELREQGCIVFLLDLLDVAGFAERERGEKGVHLEIHIFLLFFNKIHLFNLLNLDHVFILILNLMI